MHACAQNLFPAGLWRPRLSRASVVVQRVRPRRHQPQLPVPFSAGRRRRRRLSNTLRWPPPLILPHARIHADRSKNKESILWVRRSIVTFVNSLTFSGVASSTTFEQLPILYFWQSSDTQNRRTQIELRPQPTWLIDQNIYVSTHT